MFLCHKFICGLEQDVKKTISDHGKFTEPSDLTSDLCDTRKTARIKSLHKTELYLCDRNAYCI